MQAKTEAIVIQPGMYTEGSDRVAQNRWRRGNRVRFKNGFPEKIGGWQRENLAPPEGVPRSLRDWNKLDGTNVLAVGTNLGVYVYAPTEQTDITPIAKSTTGVGGTETPLTDPFITTLDSPTVVVEHVAHGLSVDAKVTFSGATPVGGLDLNGDHRVTKVDSLNQYTITAASDATSAATGGGTVEYVYRVNPGQVATAPGLGYGVGPYGAETYGTPRTPPDGLGEVSTASRARIWSLQNWGQDLMICPRGGAIYRFRGADTTPAPATLITEAPFQSLGIVMSPADRHLLAYGCTPGADGPTGALDPLVVRWCSQNNYDDWTPSTTNTSGERRLEQGTEILQGFLAGDNILFITEIAAYRFFPTTSGNVFGYKGLGEVGGVSPQGGVGFRGAGYWIGWENFFEFQGSVKELQCDVHSAVFEDINWDQRDLIVCGVNRRFSEVYWMYPSKNSSEIDRYVAYDRQQNIWHIGEWDRTAWYGNSTRFTYPYGVTSTGTIYVHEVGNTADGAPMQEWIETYDLMLPTPPGTQSRTLMRVNSIAQDFGRLDTSVQITPRYRRWPGGAYQDKAPVVVSWDPIQNRIGEIRRRGRGRYMQLRVEGAGFGGGWRWGSTDVNLQPDGER